MSKENYITRAECVALIEKKVRQIEIPDTLLTNRKVREMLGISFPTLKLMVKDNQLHTFKVGKVIKYSKNEVLQFFRFKRY